MTLACDNALAVAFSLAISSRMICSEHEVFNHVDLQEELKNLLTNGGLFK